MTKNKRSWATFTDSRADSSEAVTVEPAVEVDSDEESPFEKVYTPLSSSIESQIRDIHTPLSISTNSVVADSPLPVSPGTFVQNTAVAFVTPSSSLPIRNRHPVPDAGGTEVPLPLKSSMQSFEMCFKIPGVGDTISASKPSPQLAAKLSPDDPPCFRRPYQVSTHAHRPHEGTPQAARQLELQREIMRQRLQLQAERQQQARNQMAQVRHGIMSGTTAPRQMRFATRNIQGPKTMPTPTERPVKRTYLGPGPPHMEMKLQPSLGVYPLGFSLFASRLRRLVERLAPIAAPKSPGMASGLKARFDLDELKQLDRIPWKITSAYEKEFQVIARTIAEVERVLDAVEVLGESVPHGVNPADESIQQSNIPSSLLARLPAEFQSSRRNLERLEKRISDHEGKLLQNRTNVASQG